MHLLVIGSDRNLFKKDSDVWDRYLDYGKLFEEIHVIVFSSKNLGNKNTKIGDNVFIYPTNHIFKLLYLWNIYQISKLISKTSSLVVGSRSWVTSAQDAFESGLAAWMLKKIYKIPLQIQIHTDFLSPYFWKESFSNKLRVLLAKFLIPRADGIRVVSERIRRSLVTCHVSHVVKIGVLPIFVDTGAIKSSPITINLHNKYPQFDFIILMASRLTKEKNIGLAIEAMSELVHPRTQELGVGVKKYPKLGLVIVGSGPERKALQKLIVKGQLSNVVMEPSVTQDALFSYYKTADLFLLTSNYEGYGRTVIEAMAAGLPVVMTNVGLAGEVLIDDKNGAVISIGDKKALVRTAELLTGDDKKRNAYSLEEKKTLEYLMTKEQYLKLYKEIIGSANYEK